MMYLIKRLAILLVFTNLGFAGALSEDYIKVYNQFKNRQWYDSSKRNLEMSYYLNPNSAWIVNELKISFSTFSEYIFSVMGVTLDYLQFNTFYSSFDFTSNASVLDYSANLRDSSNYYKLRQEWTTLFLALSENQWQDTSDCDGQILSNTNCGRKSKVNHVFSNMSNSQVRSLEILNASLLNEIDGVLDSQFNLDLDENYLNLFQFYQYPRSLITLIDSRLYSLGEDNAIKTKRFVELIRALLSQVFTEEGGVLLNSNLYEIDLSPELCDDNCLKNYFLSILVSDSTDISTTVSDLVFDKKMIEKFLALYLLLDEVEKNKFRTNIYFFLKNIIGVDILDEGINLVIKDKMIDSLNVATEILIRKKDVSSLKLAKEIQLFVKGWL